MQEADRQSSGLWGEGGGGAGCPRAADTWTVHRVVRNDDPSPSVGSYLHLQA